MATSSNKVNRPTDPKQKQQDIDRKLQLYGIVEAFQSGKVPSNEQIDVSLNSFLQSRALASPHKRLSTEGQALVADFKSVVEQAKLLLLTKNEGNLLQDFIWQTQQISGGNASTPNAPVDKETAKQHGSDALQGLRTLGTLIISNGQFRKLLSDATVLARDIAGDAAEKAADKVNPSKEQLSQIDKPAEDNTWHDVPDMSRDNIKNQIKTTYNREAPVGKKDLQDAAGNATQAAHPGDSRDPRDAANLAARDQQQGTDSGVDAQSGAQNGAATLKQRASENMNPETKDKARQTKERTQNYLKDKLPEERREQTIWRLKKMVVEIQGHPDYNEAITTLLDLAEQYTSHVNNVTQQSIGTVKGAHGDSALKTAEADLKTLIERFANGTSSDDLFDSINAIYRDADRDPELKKWFKSIDSYVRKCLQQQGFILTDSANDQWNTLYDQGNFLLRDRYRNHTDRIFDEVKFLADQFDKDPQNKRFAESVNKLFTDLGNDENGNPTFKPHLIKDLTEVIIPAAFESVAYVPIPRIEYSDPMMDAVIENLVIESDNLLPNIAEFHTTNHHRFGRKNIGTSHKVAGEIAVSGIQCDLRDVSFYVHKKQGFPSIKDQGLMDIFMGGNGFSFRAKLATADSKDRQNFFKVENITVDVKNLNIKMKQSSHKLLFNVFKPLMLKVMKPALQKVLGKLIKDKMNELDGLMWRVKQEADRAMREAKNDPQNAPNIYSRYASALQKNLMQGQQKAQNVAADKKVNVAMTQHDSIFPNVKLPGGISTKATEYKDLAHKGDKWESPIFSLGSASKTSNLPSPGKVERKHHEVTTGGVRGPDNIGNTTSMTEQNRDISAQSQGQQANGFATNGGYNSSNGTTHTGNGTARTGNGTANFSNEVEQAFDEKTAAPGNGHYNTTLGPNNPLLQQGAVY